MVQLDKVVITVSDLAKKTCLPCSGKTLPLDPSQAESLLSAIPGWSIRTDGKLIERNFVFDGFSSTMAFINAMAWIAIQQDHHPDFETGHHNCRVGFTTHAIGGLSENDFICAAKVNALLDS